MQRPEDLEDSFLGRLEAGYIQVTARLHCNLLYNNPAAKARGQNRCQNDVKSMSNLTSSAATTTTATATATATMVDTCLPPLLSRSRVIPGRPWRSRCRLADGHAIATKRTPTQEPTGIAGAGDGRGCGNGHRGRRPASCPCHALSLWNSLSPRQSLPELTTVSSRKLEDISGERSGNQFYENASARTPTPTNRGLFGGGMGGAQKSTSLGVVRRLS